jgi:hypothetical protein
MKVRAMLATAMFAMVGCSSSGGASSGPPTCKGPDPGTSA